jgi:hypothetical protein
MWLFSNLRPPATFRHRAFNTSGRLALPEIRVIDEHGQEHRLNCAAGSTNPPEDHTYEIVADVPPEIRNQRLVTLVLAYVWLNGGVLTREDLQNIKPPGYGRNQQCEFETLWTPVPAASAELVLTLPPEFAPQESPTVKVRRNARDAVSHEDAELQRRLRQISLGRFALTIPFPRVDWRYDVLWKPVEARVVDQRVGRVGFEKFPGPSLEAMLRAFQEELATDPRFKTATVGLYVSGNSSRLAAWRPVVDGFRPPEAPPALISGRGDQNLVAQAWWGQGSFQARPDQQAEASARGFVKMEKLLICIPISFELGWINPPPSGVIRIGIVEESARDVPSVDDIQSETAGTLARATLKMLTSAFDPRNIMS